MSYVQGWQSSSYPDAFHSRTWCALTCLDQLLWNTRARSMTRATRDCHPRKVRMNLPGAERFREPSFLRFSVECCRQHAFSTCVPARTLAGIYSKMSRWLQQVAETEVEDVAMGTMGTSTASSSLLPRSWFRPCCSAMLGTFEVSPGRTNSRIFSRRFRRCSLPRLMTAGTCRTVTAAFVHR